jgi:hypothetical protein
MAQSTKSEIALAHIEERLTTLSDGMNKLLECINGNGKPGLKSDVHLIQEQVKDLQDDRDGKKDFGKNVILLTIGEILTFVGMVAMLIFKK